MSVGRRGFFAPRLRRSADGSLHTAFADAVPGKAMAGKAMAVKANGHQTAVPVRSSMARTTSTLFAQRASIAGDIDHDSRFAERRRNCDRQENYITAFWQQTQLFPL